MSQAKSKHAVETIVDATLWERFVDGMNAVGTKGEVALQFDESGLRAALKDAANVALIAMECDADAFEHFAVGGSGVTIGVNTEKFADLLKAAKGDDPVKFHLNAETRKFDFEANGVEYELAGVNPDSMGGTPVDIPPVKDELPYSIDVQMPVDKWSTGCDVIDLAGSGHGTFVYDPDAPGDFVLEGKGDTDTSRVVLSDHDAFEWNEPEPDTRVEDVQSNDYMPEIVSVLEDGDNDVVRFVTGNELPFHTWTSHADGRIDTKLMMAPRITSD
jgi:proliferating cell nuclear antigen